MKRFLSFLLLGFFLAGLAPLAPVNGAPAEAKTKKKIVRKVKKAKKKVRRPARKIVRKANKPPAKKAKAKKPVKPAAVKVPAGSYALPDHSGSIVQKYSLEEGIGDADADKVVNELKALGVSDASIDVNSNTLSVKFNTAELSAIGIIKKLKELGYTVKRIN